MRSFIICTVHPLLGWGLDGQDMLYTCDRCRWKDNIKMVLSIIIMSVFWWNTMPHYTGIYFL